MEHSRIITITADIVAAHVSGNKVGQNELGRLIQSVHAALDNLTKPTPISAAKPEPAVSIRSSVKPGAITCLDCGVKLKLLKRHLSADHGMTPGEYRTKWGLPKSYPLVAPEYAARRKELALTSGLGRRNAEQGSAIGPKRPWSTRLRTPRTADGRR